VTAVPVATTHSARVLPAPLVLWLAVAAAWLAIVVADATGYGTLLHHHALLENGPPLGVAVGLFLVSWQVMIAAMMLPASSVTFDRHRSLRFVAGFLVAWTVFGLFCFAGDGVLHRLVDTVPLFAANQWIIAAGILALAGAYQLTPLKRNFLDACRATAPDHAALGPLRSGIAHAIDCVGASGALMLLMFAAGFASLPWMIGLAALMFYEVRGRHATTVIRASGVVLIWFAVLATMSAVPGWVAA
jgi:predicted metal-binding membrane protein